MRCRLKKCCSSLYTSFIYNIHTFTNIYKQCTHLSHICWCYFFFPPLLNNIYTLQYIAHSPSTRQTCRRQLGQRPAPAHLSHPDNAVLFRPMRGYGTMLTKARCQAGCSVWAVCLEWPEPRLSSGLQRLYIGVV